MKPTLRNEPAIQNYKNKQGMKKLDHAFITAESAEGRGKTVLVIPFFVFFNPGYFLQLDCANASASLPGGPSKKLKIIENEQFEVLPFLAFSCLH